MSLGYQTICWGGVVGHPAGVTSVKDLYYLANGSDEQALREIAAAGYDGFEMFDGNLQSQVDNPSRFEGWLRETGLQLVAVYSGANFIYDDILEDEFWRLERAAAAAERFGATFLNIGGGAIRHAGPRSADHDALARGLDRASVLAARHGLAATYHPHLGTISQAPDQLEQVLRLTDIRLCPDTAHILAGGGDPAATIRRYRDRVAYVHLKDFADGRFLPLGEGRVDLSAVVAALGGSHTGGWWTVELDSTDRNPGEIAVQNKRVLEALLR
jgi:inosose dehydratase